MFPSLDDIALFATAPASAWYFSGTIVALALVAFVRFRMCMAPLMTEMQRACSAIEGVPDAQALVGHLPTLDTQLGNSPLLGSVWRELRATLVLPAAGEPQRLLATRDPAAVFRGRRLLAMHINVSFYHAMPNMLVGLGILGTFMGLLFGIHVASKGLAASDMAVARGALQGLLSAAALKFSTSVAGLLASLLFSWREKQWTHRFESLTSRFTAALETRLDRVTPEAIALSSLRAVARQEALLGALSARIGEAIARHLEPPLDRLANRMETQGNRIIERLEHLRHLLARTQPTPTNNSSIATSEETVRLAAILERMGTVLEVHATGLRNSSSAAAQEWSSSVREGGEVLKRELVQTLTGMLERLSHAIEEMAAQLAAAGATAARDLGHAASGVDAAGGRLAVGLASLETAATTFSRFGGEAERLLAGLRDVQTGFATTTAPVLEAAGAFRSSATRMEGVSGRVQEAAEGLRVAASDLSRMEHQVCGQWREYEERFANVDAALANTFRELDKGLSHTTLLVREWVSGLDQHTASIVRELTAATVELRETVTELTDALVEVRK